MAFTTADEVRLLTLEEVAIDLTKQLSGAASVNQLNRLLILCQDDIRIMTEQVEALEAIADELLTLTRKLQ